jgi:drug/metabolite transporter (DMT)-like permease
LRIRAGLLRSEVIWLRCKPEQPKFINFGKSLKLSWKNPHLNSETIGLIYGFLGVVGFSLTLPATRAAVIDLDPLFVGLGRGLVAGILAAFTLRITHQPIPSKQPFRSLLVVGLGVVVGFPILSAWAMQQVPAAHGAVVLGLLPLATAIAGVLRAGDRPDFSFWIASIFGSSGVKVISKTNQKSKLIASPESYQS